MSKYRIEESRVTYRSAQGFGRTPIHFENKRISFSQRTIFGVSVLEQAVHKTTRLSGKITAMNDDNIGNQGYLIGNPRILDKNLEIELFKIPRTELTRTFEHVS